MTTAPLEKLAGKDLSRREIQVLLLAGRGLANEEIGARLFVSADTVRTHMRRTIAKLGAEDRTHAVSLYLARQMRPLLAAFPRCRTHPTIAPLPGECPECAWWVDARRLSEDVGAVLAGDGP